MASEGILLFGNDTGGGGQASQFDQTSFLDTTLPATSNAGFSSTILRNPMGSFFGNDGAPKWMSKKLLIQDLQLIEDRSKWINQRATYNIIWNAPFPGANGYVFGDVQVHANVENRNVSLNLVGDGFGIGGVIRRVQWLVKPSALGTATAAQFVDGVGIGNIDFSSAFATGPQTQGKLVYNAYTHSNTNETHDIHDYQLTANQSGNLTVYGAVVYFEVPASGIDCFAGNIYLNKTLLSPLGTTLAFPSAGTSNFLGGKAGVFLTAQGGFGVTTSLVQDLQTAANGNSGTNLINVASGVGGSFPQGTALWSPNGTTHWLGGVLSRSGDVLTVGPTLSPGVSNIMHAIFQAGSTFAISSTLFQQSWDYTPNMNQMPAASGSSAFFSRGLLDFGDPSLRYKIWGFSLAMRSGASLSANVSGQTYGIQALGATSGFLQIDGFMSGLELEFVAGTSASLNYTLIIDGMVTTSLNETLSGAGLFRRTVFTNAGLGWHSVRLVHGQGSTQTMVSRVIAYEPKLSIGSTTVGLLAEIPLYMTFIQRNTQGATVMALGNVQRLYNENLYYKGANWARVPSAAVGGGVDYQQSASAGDSMRFSYFGTRFNVFSSQGGASVSFNVDGVLDASATYGLWSGTGLTLGFHTVVVTNLDTNITAMGPVDFYSPVSHVNNRQTPFPDDISRRGVRFFSQTQAPSGERPGDIWEMDKDNAVAYQHVFGGWNRLNISNPLCYVGNGTNYSCPDSVAFRMQGTTIFSDPFGMAASTVAAGVTLSFTVPCDGNYQLVASANFAANATGRRELQALVQGQPTTYVFFRQAASAGNDITGSATILFPNLKKGNVVQPLVFQTSTATLTIQGDLPSNFVMFNRVGP